MRGTKAKAIRNSVEVDVVPGVREQRRYARNHRGDLVVVGLRGSIQAAKRETKRRDHPPRTVREKKGGRYAVSAGERMAFDREKVGRKEVAHV